MIKNVMKVFNQSTRSEREWGHMYYDIQRRKIDRYMCMLPELSLENGVAAFCALSPSNSEKNTYQALYTCMGIARGDLPELTHCSCWPVNKVKAIQLLRGGDPQKILRGRKVVSFFHNTLDPDDEDYITVDGHIYSVWRFERYRMKEVPYLGSSLYNRISDDIRMVAELVRMPAPKLQATLWLAWKRINGILYDAQMEFQW